MRKPTGTYNLIGNSIGSEGITGSTNLLGSPKALLDPRIGPLKDNGGPTWTRALHTRSPALNQGISLAIGIDQRGQTRPYSNALIPNAAGGDGSDIGAFERTFSPTAFDFDIDAQASPCRSLITGTIQAESLRRLSDVSCANV